jgi:hypothetical protein
MADDFKSQLLARSQQAAALAQSGAAQAKKKAIPGLVNILNKAQDKLNKNDTPADTPVYKVMEKPND